MSNQGRAQVTKKSPWCFSLNTPPLSYKNEKKEKLSKNIKKVTNLLKYDRKTNIFFEDKLTKQCLN